MTGTARIGVLALVLAGVTVAAAAASFDGRPSAEHRMITGELKGAPIEIGDPLRVVEAVPPTPPAARETEVAIAKVRSPETAAALNALPPVPLPPGVTVKPGVAGDGTAPAKPKPKTPSPPARLGTRLPLDDTLPQPPPLPEAERATGYTSTNFDLLSNYDAGKMGQFGPTPEMVADGELQRVVPKEIWKLNKTKIGISGYMIPVDFERNSVQTFILCRWQPGCCFGHVPLAHEQIFVSMPGESGTRFVIIPVTVYGTFKIGRDSGDAGGALSLYRIDAEKVTIPEDW